MHAVARIPLDYAGRQSEENAVELHYGYTPLPHIVADVELWLRTLTPCSRLMLRLQDERMCDALHAWLRETDHRLVYSTTELYCGRQLQESFRDHVFVIQVAAPK